MTKVTLLVNGGPLEFTLDDGILLDVREGAVSIRHMPQSQMFSRVLSLDNPHGAPEPLGNGSFLVNAMRR